MIEWKQIPKYPEYEASKCGKVRETISQRVLSTNKNKNNNPFKRNVACLRINGKIIQLHVSRCVAMAWIPNPEKKKEVNHIDGNVQNDCVDNLEWVTRSENMIHAVKTGLLKKKKKLRPFA